MIENLNLNTIYFEYTTMKIKTLKIQNFRGIIDEEIDLDPTFTVFAGRNGGGKSTALEAIAIMLSRISGRMPNSAQGCEELLSRDITYGRKFAKLGLVIGDSDKPDVELMLEYDINGTVKENSEVAELCAKEVSGVFAKADSPEVELPVFAFYRSDRNTSGFRAPRPAEALGRMSVFKNTFNAGTNFDDFSEWLANVLNERTKEIAQASTLPLKKGNEARDAIERKYRFVSEIKRALKEFSQNLAGFYTENGKLFVEPRKIPAEYLSQGEKTAAALIADIALRMAVANPYSKNPLSTNAIIMIDEIDLHLHTDWQATIASKLQKIFPRTQFIVSSHSPSVLSSVKSVYKFNETIEGFAKAEHSSQFGRAPSDVLNDYFHAQREPSIAAEISAMYTAIDECNLSHALEIIDRLHEVIPDDPDIIRGEYLVRALESKKK